MGKISLRARKGTIKDPMNLSLALRILNGTFYERGGVGTPKLSTFYENQQCFTLLLFNSEKEIEKEREDRKTADGRTRTRDLLITRCAHNH